MSRIQEIPEGTERKGETRSLTISPAEFLVQAVRERWKIYLRQRGRCARGNIMAVHELRVSIRRLMEAVDFMLDVVADSEAAHARKKLKKQISRLGTFRDIQVQRGALEKFLPEHPGIAPLVEKLRRAEKKKGSEIIEIAEKPKKETLRRAVLRLQKKILTEFDTPAEREMLLALMNSSVDAAFRRVLARCMAVRPNDISTIHSARLAFKRFRYLLELLHPIFPGVGERALAEARNIQSCMGEIHDTEVLLQTMREYEWKGAAAIADHMRIRRSLQSHRRNAIEELMKMTRNIGSLWKT